MYVLDGRLGSSRRIVRFSAATTNITDDISAHLIHHAPGLDCSGT
ncbi:MAG: hypothetical protein WKF96_01695 [Solirubrobacteraceae bacterium]